MATISSCLICKNEMPYILKLLKQLAEFSDEIILVDTGSTDGLLDITVQSSFPKCVKLDHFRWINDFAAARNYSFSKASMDMIFWCDCDDWLTPDLIAYLNHLKQFDVSELPDTLDIPYQYWVDRDGIDFLKTRLIKRSLNIPWVGRIHEALLLDPDSPAVVPDQGSQKIIHKHKKVHTDRNLKIFEEMDSSLEIRGPRELYYYAMELFNFRKFIPAYLLLQECALDNSSYWVDRVNSVNNCKNIQEWIKYDFTKPWYSIAEELLHSGVGRPDMYCMLGDHYFQQEQFNEAYRLYTMALNSSSPTGGGTFLYDEQYHTTYPLAQLVITCWKLNKIDDAILFNERLLGYAPNNSNALYNKNFFNSLKNGNTKG